MTDMPERDFEKQVQQVMEPFQLAPDTRLFPAILDQVRRRRKRRRRIFWLLMPLILLPATFFLLYQPGKKAALPEQVAQAGKQELPAAAITATAPLPITPVTGVPQPNTEQPSGGRPVTESGLTDVNYRQPVASLKPRKRISGKKAARTIVTTSNGETENDRETAGDASTAITEAVPAGRIVSTATATTVTPRDTSMAIPIQSAAAMKKDTTQTAKKEIATKKDTPQTAQKEIASPEKKRKLTWLITAAAGISGMGNRYTQADLFNNEALTGTGNMPGTAGNTFTPGRIRNGPGFMAGIGLQWSLTEKVRLLSGLQYRYQSSWIGVGDAVRAGQLQGSAADQYTVGNKNQYRNNIHSVSLPVTLHIEVIRIGAHALEMRGGVYTEHIIRSSLLQFNPYSGTYYQDKMGMRRWLAGFQLGAALNLSGKNKPALYLGPEYWQSFQPAADGGLYARSRYHFIGLRLSREF